MKILKITVFCFVVFTMIYPLHAHVKTGIEVLREKKFEPLSGKRVGLITNPTGVDRNLKSTIDILAEADNFELIALYGPEHGVRGNYNAGDLVGNDYDTKTGIPMFSLYGSARKPTPEMLEDIDVLIYDIQDIGSRSYTYISTMGLAMEAAAENDIEFMVLDRPNPLGGYKFEGPLVEEGFLSFVSQFPIPYVHGFTVGELATFLNNEGLLADRVKANLTVINMKGWERRMAFEDTGLPWVMSSPHIPQYQSAYFYPVSGILGELYTINIGVGYTLPFQVFGAPWIEDPETLAENLNQLKLPGVQFRPIHYRPYYTELKGQDLGGVQVHIPYMVKSDLSIIQFYVMQEIYKLYPEYNVFEMAPERLDMFDKVCGTDKIRKTFEQRFLVEDILDMWTEESERFAKKASEYFVY
ncbi:MAG: exo-beta-N-acetylmuramidase NamZ domain-containing protein [Bacteroidales bacterium]